jgi:hypothetical protein
MLTKKLQMSRKGWCSRKLLVEARDEKILDQCSGSGPFWSDLDLFGHIQITRFQDAELKLAVPVNLIRPCLMAYNQSLKTS